MSRRGLAVTAAAAVAVALWLVVLVDFPSFHGNAHLPALGPSPGALATPGPLPSGEASNPQAQAGLPRHGTHLTGGGSGAADVEDEPPDVEDEPAVPSLQAPASVGHNPVPTPSTLPVPLPTLPLPTPHVP